MTPLRRTALLCLLALTAGGDLSAQPFGPDSGWEEVEEGVWEHRVDAGRRVERLALDEGGLRWALDRLRQEEERWDDLAARAREVSGPEADDLAREVRRLEWALDALEILALEFEGGSEEVAEALKEAREGCGFGYDGRTTAAGGLPASWVYPFGLRGGARASWSTACDAEALVLARVAVEAAGLGFRAGPERTLDRCLARGTRVECRAQAETTGFAPCRASVVSAVLVPELGFYFEAEETSTACGVGPIYPDPDRYR